jgi:hypothetical protein
LGSADTINSSHRTPRLSSDGQFWLRMALVLPFSLAAWVVVVCWAVQEVPIYASQLVNGVSNWTDATRASAVTLLTGRKGDANGVASGRPKRHVSRSLSGYPHSWQWRGLLDTGRLSGLSTGDASSPRVAVGENRIRQKAIFDPFGVAKFLEFLRRSNHHAATFVQPRPLFPITQHAIEALLHGSHLPLSTRSGFGGLTRLASGNDGSFPVVSSVNAGFPWHFELGSVSAIRE